MNHLQIVQVKLNITPYETFCVTCILSGPIYGIMTQCWHPTPEQRPSFALILERLDYCSQDPEVMNAPLPVFNRPPSHERDATLMRPLNSDDTCLQVSF